MRNILLATAILVVLLGIGVGAYVWSRRGAKPDVTRGREAATAAVIPDIEETLPPAPDISLQINRKRELAAYQGTPLIFSVSLDNPRAINAAAENHARKAFLEHPVEVRAVQLGDEATSWETFVHFEQQLPDGKRQPLGWALKLIQPPEAKSLTLDAERTADLDYVLEPSAAAGISLGKIQIVAVFEVPANAPLAPGRWRGKVDSRPVNLRIVARPARLEKAEEAQWELDQGRYYFAAGDSAQAVELAAKALTANPKSLPALILLGDAQERRGDMKAALAAYQKAEQQFYVQHPNSSEAPLYLVGKMSDLQEKLGAGH